MKLTSMLAALAGLAILVGCDDVSTPSLLSVEEVAADSDLSAVPGLAGVWENGQNMIIVRPEKDSAGRFHIVYVADGSHSFDARAFYAGDAPFLEVTPDGDSDDFHIDGHAIARIWVEGNTFRWCFVDSDWFKQQVSALPLSQRPNDKTLVLSPGRAVMEALTKYGGDERAHGQVATWTRMQ